VYIYTASSNPYSAVATGFDSLGGGWYKVTLTKTEPGTTPTTATLVGLTGLGAGVKYRIGRVQLLPYPSTSDIAGTSTRTWFATPYYPSTLTRRGSINANSIERGTNPWGELELLWRGQNHSSINTNANFNLNAGFTTLTYPVDRTKKYRFSLWVNRKVLGDGTVYFGPTIQPLLIKSTGAVNSNPYFAVDSSSSTAYTGKQNTWVLVVGCVHPVGTATGSNDPSSGYYTRAGGGVTYAPTSSGDTDYIFQNTSTEIALRSFLYGSSILKTEVQFLRPRIDLMDGSEPSIDDLLNNTPDTVYDLSPTGSISSVKGKPQYSSVNGGQLVFNGKSHSIVRSGSVFSNLTDIGNKTWEVWTTPQLVQTGGHVSMFCGAGGLPYFGNTDMQILWSVSANGQQNITSPSILFSSPESFIGKPTHLVFVSTYDSIANSTRYQIYRNGVSVRDSQFSGKQIYSSTQVGIGNRGTEDQTYYTTNGSDYEYNGSIAVVRVYDRALTKQEIQQNFNSTRNRFGV